MMNNVLEIITIIVGIILIIVNIKETISALYDLLLVRYLKFLDKRLHILRNKVMRHQVLVRCEDEKAPICIKFNKLQQKEENVIDIIIDRFDKKSLYIKLNSFTELMHYVKKIEYNYALSGLSICAIFYCGIDLFFYINAEIEFIIFLDVLICIIVISKSLVSYRVKKGYYGSSYEEAKELLHYLTKDDYKNYRPPGMKTFNEIVNYNKAKETVPDGELQY